MLITFSGVDGSGKSTQVNFVVTWLRERGFQPVCLHLTQWTWVYLIGEKWGRKKMESEKVDVPNSPLLPVQLLRQLVSLGDLLRFKLLWWRIKRHGGILICDRYFYDLGISALYRQTMSPWTVNVIWKNAPRPDLAFFLDVIPEMAQQREGEHPVDYYIEKRRLYLNVMSTWPMVMLPSATIAQIQTQIETALEEQVVMAI